MRCQEFRQAITWSREGEGLRKSATTERRIESLQCAICAASAFASLSKEIRHGGGLDSDLPDNGANLRAKPPSPFMRTDSREESAQVARGSET